MECTARRTHSPALLGDRRDLATPPRITRTSGNTAPHRTRVAYDKYFNFRAVAAPHRKYPAATRKYPPLDPQMWARARRSTARPRNELLIRSIRFICIANVSDM